MCLPNVVKIHLMLTMLLQPLGKKYHVLTKRSKDTLNVNDVITVYSLRVAKYNKNEFQNLQDLKGTGDGLVKFQFKLGYVEEQLNNVSYGSNWEC